MAIICCGQRSNPSPITDRPTLAITVGKEQIPALFDTGAEICLLAKSIYDRLPADSRPKLEPCNLGLTTANGGGMAVVGQIQLSMLIGPRKVKSPVVIVDGLYLPCIIGVDLMRRENIQIDPCNRKVKLGKRPEEKIALRVARNYSIEPCSSQILQVTLPPEFKNLKATTSILVTGDRSDLTIEPGLFSVNEGLKVMSVSGLQGAQLNRNDEIGVGEIVDGAYLDLWAGSMDRQLQICLANINSRQKPRLSRAEVDPQLVRVPTEHKNDFANIILEYSDVFSSTANDVGKCGVIKQDIKLIDPTKVCSTPPYRLPHHLLPVAHKFVQDLLSARIIRPSKSPFSSPLMLVRKPGLPDPSKPLEQQWRLVHDYRKLNLLTEKDAYPMRNLFELIDEVSQGHIYSIIDLSQGFWNQELEETARAKTSFGVQGLGHFEYTRSAQGLCNSPAAFQRLLDYITTGLEGTYVYVDDLVIVSKSYEQHKRQLKALFQRFRKYGLKCRFSKLQLATDEINYLGYNISQKKGVRPGLLKTQAISNWQPPRDVTQIRQFLGLCSFFRRTIPDFAQIASPLTKLTRKDAEWKTGELPPNAKEAFESLKSKLSSRPCLKPVNFDREFIVTVDSSTTGVGAILSQLDERGVEHPCAYASRVLTDPETRYAPCHLEAAGILWAHRHFRPYLIGRHHTVRTDHKPLLSLNKTHSFALDRIYAEMVDFLPFTIEYLAGTKMPADGLSRLSQVSANLQICSADWSVHLSTDQLFQLQCEDKYIKALVCFLKYGRLPKSANLKRFLGPLSRVAEIRDGLVGMRYQGNFLTLAPLNIRPTLLSLAHDDKLAGHLGAEKTRLRLQQMWYWPNMRAEIDAYCRSCVSCQQVNQAAHSRPAPLEPMPPVTRFNERLHLDLLGPLPLGSVTQAKYLLCLVDSFSGWVDCVAIPSKEAEVVYRAFLDTWVAQYSFPERVHSDLGSEFHNSLFKELSAKIGFRHSFSSAAHPMSNGTAERANRSIIAYMRKFIETNAQWEELLMPLKFAINSAPHATKRYTPFQLVYGRRPTMAFMLYHPTRSYSEVDAEQRLALLNRMTQEVCKWQTEAFRVHKAEFDKRAKQKEFRVGDIVYAVRGHQGDLFQKFQPTFEGPFTIIKTLDHNNYVIEDCNLRTRTRTVHSNLLKPGSFREQLYDEFAPLLPLTIHGRPTNDVYNHTIANLPGGGGQRITRASAGQNRFVLDDEEFLQSGPPAAAGRLGAAAAAPHAQFQATRPGAHSARSTSSSGSGEDNLSQAKRGEEGQTSGSDDGGGSRESSMHLADESFLTAGGSGPDDPNITIMGGDSDSDLEGHEPAVQLSPGASGQEGHAYLTRRRAAERGIKLPPAHKQPYPDK